MLALASVIFSSVMSGGATGILGVLIQRFFDMKNKAQDLEVLKLNHANALALANIESERAQVRADADIQIADRQSEAAEEQAAERSLVASYEADKATYLSPDAQKRKGKMGAAIAFMMALVDFARGMLRPGLTMYLTGVTSIMFWHVMTILNARGTALTTDKLEELLTQITATILYCTTTCIVWWFGSRPKGKQ